MCKNSGSTSTTTIDILKSALQRSYPQSNVKIHIHTDPPHRCTYQTDLHSCGAFTIDNILQIARHINKQGQESILYAFQYLPFTNSEELKTHFPYTYTTEGEYRPATPLVYGGQPSHHKQSPTQKDNHLTDNAAPPNSQTQESSVTLANTHLANPTPPKKQKSSSISHDPQP